MLISLTAFYSIFTVCVAANNFWDFWTPHFDPFRFLSNLSMPSLTSTSNTTKVIAKNPSSFNLFQDDICILFKKHSQLPVSDFILRPEDNEKKLNGCFEKFVLRHLKFPKIRFLYKPSPSDHGVLVPGDVIAYAERASYIFFSKISEVLDIPVIPVSMLDWESNGWLGSVQPMVEDVLAMTADPIETGMTKENLVHMLRQHWLDLFISDLDGFRDNWLVMSTTGRPIRIDHGWSFHDDIVKDKFPVKHMFGWKSVLHRVLLLYRNNQTLVHLAQRTLAEVTDALQKCVTNDLLNTMFSEFFSLYPDYREGQGKRKELCQKYMDRAKHFPSFAKSYYNHLRT
jgi:hypothetical protein